MLVPIVTLAALFSVDKYKELVGERHKGSVQIWIPPVVRFNHDLTLGISASELKSVVDISWRKGTGALSLSFRVFIRRPYSVMFTWFISAGTEVTSFCCQVLANQPLEIELIAKWDRKPNWGSLMLLTYTPIKMTGNLIGNLFIIVMNNG